MSEDEKRMRGKVRPAPLFVSAFLSFLIGIVAGLLGVGGGEFRLPILICILGFSVPEAAAANLVVGILTVYTGLTKRLSVGMFDPASLFLIIFMSAGSIFGAYAGAKITNRASEKKMKHALGILLVVLGLKFIHGAFAEEAESAPVLGGPFDLVLGAGLGALIGIVCGSLGVAGGELRIPALVYLFGMGVKGAGTVSLAVSLPTVVAGAFKYGRMGRISWKVARVSMAMGIPAIIGSYIGAAIVPGTSEFVLKIFLGIILLLATVRAIKP